MNADRLQADEYELQYYGCTSTEIIVEFLDCVEYHIKEALDYIEKTWLEMNSYYDNNIIKAQMADLQKLYQRTMKDSIRNFQETINEIFQIHPNVLLEGQEIYKKEYSPEELAKLKQEVESLEQEFLRERLFIKRCKDHKNIINKLKPLYESTNVKIKTVPSLMAANTKIEMINTFLKLQKDYIIYCSNDKADSYAKYCHLFPTRSSDET